MDGHASVQNKILRLKRTAKMHLAEVKDSRKMMWRPATEICDTIVLYIFFRRTPPALIVLLHVRS